LLVAATLAFGVAAMDVHAQAQPTDKQGERQAVLRSATDKLNATPDQKSDGKRAASLPRMSPVDVPAK
jgi:hypothetical protein